MSTSAIDNMLEEEDGVVPAPSNTQLSEVTELTDEYQRLAAEIASEEAATKIKGERLRLISENLLPTAMKSCGLSSFKTAAGQTVKIESIIAARITEERREAAIAWLRSNGHEGLIVTEVKVNGKRGQDDKIVAARETLEKLGLEIESKPTVHWKTLSKWAKEMTEDGHEFPRDLFGVFVGSRATIK